VGEDTAVANLFGGEIVTMEGSDEPTVAVVSSPAAPATKAPQDDVSSAWETGSEGGGGLGSPQPPTTTHQPMASPDVRNLPNFRIMEGLFEEGYDTDGQPPPQYNEEAEAFDEESIGGELEEETPTDVDQTSIFVAISADELAKMTVSTLKRIHHTC
jgi:hypothetical protein